MAIANSETAKPSNHTNPSRPRRKLIRNIIIGLVGFAVCGGVIAIVGLILLVNSLKGLGDIFDSPMCDESTPAGVQAVGEFKLPPSAKLLHSGCGGLQGIWVEAQFTMKPNELNTFLATTNIKSPLSTTSRPEKLICNCKSEGITEYLYGGSKKPEWEEEVFIDTHDKNLYTVYFTVLGG